MKKSFGNILSIIVALSLSFPAIAAPVFQERVT